MRSSLGAALGRRSTGSSKPPPPPADTRWYEDQFAIYADESDGIIGPDGVEKLCKALELDPSDVHVLVLAWVLGAAQMGYFSSQEWTSGIESIGPAQTEGELRDRLKDIYIRTRRSGEQLRDLHRFTHKFCRCARTGPRHSRSHTLPTRRMRRPCWLLFLSLALCAGKSGRRISTWTRRLRCSSFCMARRSLSTSRSSSSFSREMTRAANAAYPTTSGRSSSTSARRSCQIAPTIRWVCIEPFIRASLAGARASSRAVHVSSPPMVACAYASASVDRLLLSSPVLVVPVLSLGHTAH